MASNLKQWRGLFKGQPWTPCEGRAPRLARLQALIYLTLYG